MSTSSNETHSSSRHGLTGTTSLLAIGTLATITLLSVPDIVAPADEAVFTLASVTMPVNSSGNNASTVDVLAEFISMLKQGRENVSRMSSYRVEFHKQERIDGDLRKRQLIDMVVRHAPFAVGMKWKTGSKGQRLKFVPGENEDKALVRLGGLKGRLLGKIRIDPAGSRALSDSRYPLTEAGILPLIDSVLEQAKVDLSGATQATCQIVNDQQMHAKDCYCLIVRYPNPEASPEFRQGVVYLDKETFIPVRVCRYVWGVDAEDLTPEELDELTLVEDYSFENLEELPDDHAEEVLDGIL